MNKIENSSGNLREMFSAWADGKSIQFKATNKWATLLAKNIHFLTTDEGLSYEWRIKPDAFQEWFQNRSGLLYTQEYSAKAGWDAAMKYKDDEQTK